jgi:hypothetical protein
MTMNPDSNPAISTEPLTGTEHPELATHTETEQQQRRQFKAHDDEPTHVGPVDELGGEGGVE